jgi:superoxide dismutase
MILACLMQAESKGDLATMIKLQGAIKFNGGGHINHAIFWSNLLPPKACLACLDWPLIEPAALGCLM